MLSVLWLTTPFFDLRRDNYGKSGKFKSPVWRKKRKSLSNCREIFDESVIYQIELNFPLPAPYVLKKLQYCSSGCHLAPQSRQIHAIWIYSLLVIVVCIGGSFLTCVDCFYLINNYLYLGGCERSPPRNFLTSLN